MSTLRHTLMCCSPIPVPEDLSAQYEKPDKEEVIACFVSRSNGGQFKPYVVAFLIRKL